MPTHNAATAQTSPACAVTGGSRRSKGVGIMSLGRGCRQPATTPPLARAKGDFLLLTPVFGAMLQDPVGWQPDRVADTLGFEVLHPDGPVRRKMALPAREPRRAHR